MTNNAPTDTTTDPVMDALAELKAMVRNLEDGLQLLIKDRGLNEKKEPRKIVPPVAI